MCSAECQLSKLVKLQNKILYLYQFKSELCSLEADSKLLYVDINNCNVILLCN